MEALFPASFMSNVDWFDDHQESQNTYWTKEENKRFEHALAIYGEDVPDRWIKVAEMLPGKTVSDVIKQYRELEEDVSDIEAGRVPIPGYFGSSFTLELVDSHDFDAYRKRTNGAKGLDHERKKGVPWTEEEHRRFLMGLIKYGKGDWRNISRNFVVSKTPTQVASHAQKYYQRQLSGGKDKRRPSIHDITVLNLANTVALSNDRKPPSVNQSDVLALQRKLAGMSRGAGLSLANTAALSNYRKPPSVNQSDVLTLQRKLAGMSRGAGLNWNQTNDGLAMDGNWFTSSNGPRLQGQNLYGSYHGAHIKPQSSVF